MIDDVVRGEMAERELDHFIERRSRGVDPDEREELWMESVRRYNTRLDRERLWEHLGYHKAMLESHTRTFEEILRRHRVGLRLCEEALGIVADERIGA